MGGVFAALAVVIMSLGTIIPVATYVCPVACMLILQLVVRMTGVRMPGIEPRLPRPCHPHWDHTVLVTGPPGSPSTSALIYHQ